MQNVVPARGNDVPVAHRSVDRALATRRTIYEGEVRRLIDATYEVIEQTGDVDAPVRAIVAASGLSNQAFYRHFTSKDELLLAVIDDGRRQLVATLERRLRRAQPGVPRVRAWIESILAQAQDPVAAARTRPFAVAGARLSARFPDQAAESNALLVGPLAIALAEAGVTDPRATPLIARIVMSEMHEDLIVRRAPSSADVDALVDFILRGLEVDR
ncbi:MAG: TetR/AcrR family transcriptional regulator [Acidimicrobiia bacterium]